MSVSRDELERRLKDYGCGFHADMGASMDMWLTGWGQPFFYHVQQVASTMTGEARLQTRIEVDFREAHRVAKDYVEGAIAALPPNEQRVRCFRCRDLFRRPPSRRGCEGIE